MINKEQYNSSEEKDSQKLKLFNVEKIAKRIKAIQSEGQCTVQRENRETTFIGLRAFKVDAFLLALKYT